jgi:hypothetical protein
VEVSAGARLTHRHPRALAPGAIFTRLLENFFDLRLRDSVLVDVRESTFRVEVEANLHGVQVIIVAGLSTSTDE